MLGSHRQRASGERVGCWWCMHSHPWYLFRQGWRESWGPRSERLPLLTCPFPGPALSFFSPPTFSSYPGCWLTLWCRLLSGPPHARDPLDMLVPCTPSPSWEGLAGPHPEHPPPSMLGAPLFAGGTRLLHFLSHVFRLFL